MKYFHSGGGNNRPSFPYAFRVTQVSNDMWNWCEAYPLTGPFERWHVQYNTGNFERDTVITFESRKAAYMFRIAFSECILENKSMYELDNI